MSLVPLITVLHEAGHALAAPLAGYRVSSFGVGLGRPLLRRSLGRGRVIWLGRWPLAGGACVAVPAGLRARPAVYHLGGLVAQLVLALVLRQLVELHWLLARAEVFNLVVLAWNSIPWRWGGQASDGWFLVAGLRRGQPALPIMGRRPVLERLVRFEDRIGAPVGAWYARLGLAWIQLLVGRPGLAAAFFALEEPEGLGPADRGLRALQGYVEVEWQRLAGREQQALEVARAWLARLGTRVPDGAEDLSTLAVARALLACGQPTQARQVLATLAGVVGPVAREASVVLLGACLLEGEASAVRAAAWRLVGQLPGSFFEPVELVRALWAAGELLDPDDPDRRRFQGEARRAAARLLAWAEPADRATLIERLGAPAGLRLEGTP